MTAHKMVPGALWNATRCGVTRLNADRCIPTIEGSGEPSHAPSSCPYGIQLLRTTDTLCSVLWSSEGQLLCHCDNSAAPRSLPNAHRSQLHSSASSRRAKLVSFETPLHFFCGPVCIAMDYGEMGANGMNKARTGLKADKVSSHPVPVIGIQHRRRVVGCAASLPSKCASP